MQIRLLIGFCFVLTWSEIVRGDGENEAKRGIFPFMAFLYYPDEGVVDSMGVRFQRSAVLIRPEWLLSTSIDHPVLDNIPLGFPRKTLLARAGAASIDIHFTLNEDEDEQEREVIQIVRPSIHNVEVWWFTDITLLKTLMPFKMTSAVSTTPINPKREYMEKNCIILVYAKRYGNQTEDRILMQLSVELLTASIENCGKHFTASTMTCAIDSEETKSAAYDPNFCQGNSGGPLMCEGEVMGLQTYVENDCKQPHLYQLLASWDSFIACGTQEKCNQDYLCNICTAYPKDEKSTTTTTEAFTIISSTSELHYKTELPESTDNILVPTTMDLTVNEVEVTTASVSVETTTAIPKTTVADTTPSSTPAPTVLKTTSHSTEASIVYSGPVKPWPIGNPKESNESDQINPQIGKGDHFVRAPKVEAQVEHHATSAGDRTIYLMTNLFFVMFLFTCMF